MAYSLLVILLGVSLSTTHAYFEAIDSFYDENSAAEWVITSIETSDASIDEFNDDYKWDNIDTHLATFDGDYITRKCRNLFQTSSCLCSFENSENNNILNLNLYDCRSSEAAATEMYENIMKEVDNKISDYDEIISGMDSFELFMTAFDTLNNRKQELENMYSGDENKNNENYIQQKQEVSDELFNLINNYKTDQNGLGDWWKKAKKHASDIKQKASEAVSSVKRGFEHAKKGVGHAKNLINSGKKAWEAVKKGNWGEAGKHLKQGFEHGKKVHASGKEVIKHGTEAYKHGSEAVGHVQAGVKHVKEGHKQAKDAINKLIGKKGGSTGGAKKTPPTPAQKKPIQKKPIPQKQKKKSTPKKTKTKSAPAKKSTPEKSTRKKSTTPKKAKKKSTTPKKAKKKSTTPKKAKKTSKKTSKKTTKGRGRRLLIDSY